MSLPQESHEMSLYLSCCRISQPPAPSIEQAQEEVQQSHVAQLRHDAFAQNCQGDVCSYKFGSHAE